MSLRNLPVKTFVNDLERPVFEKFVFLAQIKMWLLKQPEVGAALMSGSGSTVFAVMRTNLNADLVAQRAKRSSIPSCGPARAIRSSYSSRLRRMAATARAYSRFSFAMKLALISAGQTASHS